MKSQPEKPLIILASARKQSDTRLFLDRVFKEVDHQLIDLLDYSIAPYDYTGKYPANDDFLNIVDQIHNHHTIAFATPVYWYSMSGPMKIFFDRFSDLITLHKPSGRKLKDKAIFLLCVGAEDKMPEGFELPFSSTSAYLNMKFIAHIYYSVNVSKSEEELNNNIFIFLEKIKESISKDL